MMTSSVSETAGDILILRFALYASDQSHGSKLLLHNQQPRRILTNIMDQQRTNEEPTQIPGVPTREWGEQHLAHPGLFGSQTSLSTASSEETVPCDGSLGNSPWSTGTGNCVLHEGRNANTGS